MGGLSDAEVMAASCAQPELFASVYDRHSAEVFRFLARRVGRDIGEVLLGDLFRIAFERRAAFDTTRASALPWLFGIGANLVRSHARTEARRLRMVASLPVDRSTGDPDIDDLASAIDAASLLPTVIDAIESLSQEERETLLLYAWEQLPYDEIALTLEVPVGTVRSRLNRARGRLRELVAVTGQVPEERRDP